MLSSARPIDGVTRDNDDFRQSRVFTQRAAHRCGVKGLARHDRLALPANDDDGKQQKPATRNRDCHVFTLFGGGKNRKRRRSTRRNKLDVVERFSLKFHATSSSTRGYEQVQRVNLSEAVVTTVTPNLPHLVSNNDVLEVHSEDGKTQASSILGKANKERRCRFKTMRRVRQ